MNGAFLITPRVNGAFLVTPRVNGAFLVSPRLGLPGGDNLGVITCGWQPGGDNLGLPGGGNLGPLGDDNLGSKSDASRVANESWFIFLSANKVDRWGSKVETPSLQPLTRRGLRWRPLVFNRESRAVRDERPQLV